MSNSCHFGGKGRVTMAAATPRSITLAHGSYASLGGIADFLLFRTPSRMRPFGHHPEALSRYSFRQHRFLLQVSTGPVKRRLPTSLTMSRRKAALCVNR